MRLTRLVLVLAALAAALSPARAQQTFVPLKSGIVRVSVAPSTTPGACASVAATAPAQFVQSGADVGKFYWCDPSVSGGTWTLVAMTSAVATALAANGSNCSAGSFPLGVDASGVVEGCTSLASSNAGTASALAANGANCSAGQSPLGVSAAGAAENCFAVMTALDYDPGVDGAVDLAEWATVAAALAANGGNCSAGSFPLGVGADGAVEGCTALSSSNAGTASALAADGGNCSAGSFPLGVDASGAVQSCTAISSSAAGTAAALAADPANCSSGLAAGGVTAAGTAESCVDPIVNLGTDPVGTLPGPSGGSGRTTNPANEIIYGGASNAQTSTPNYAINLSGSIITLRHPSDTDCAATLGPNSITLSDDADCTSAFDQVTSVKPLVIGTSGSTLQVLTTAPGATMSFATAEGIGLTLENGAANMFGLVASDPAISGGTVAPDESIVPSGTSLPAASNCPIGAEFILTSAASGEQNYFCEDTDADSTGDSYVHPPGGGAPVGADGALQFNDGGAAGGSDCNSPSGSGISCAGTGEFGTNAADGTWGSISRENATDLAAPAAVSGVNRVSRYFKTNHQMYLRHTGGSPEMVPTTANEAGDLALAIVGDTVEYQIGANACGDAEVVDTITASNYLPLAGGTISGNIACSGSQTICGVNPATHDHSSSTGQARLATKDRSRQWHWYKTTAETTTATQAELTVAMSPQAAVTVTSAYFTPDTALACNDTNNLIFTVFKRTSAGTTQTQLFQKNTSCATGAALVQFDSLSLGTVAGGGADAIAAGTPITFSVTKNGSLTAIRGSLTINYTVD